LWALCTTGKGGKGCQGSCAIVILLQIGIWAECQNKKDLHAVRSGVVGRRWWVTQVGASMWSLLEGSKRATEPQRMGKAFFFCYGDACGSLCIKQGCVPRRGRELLPAAWLSGGEGVGEWNRSRPEADPETRNEGWRWAGGVSKVCWKARRWKNLGKGRLKGGWGGGYRPPRHHLERTQQNFEPSQLVALVGRQTLAL